MEQGALQYQLNLPLPELSRVVRLDEITATPQTMILDATTLECSGLAERFDLPYVRNLSVEITYRRTRSGQMVRVDGRITANFSQLCSVSMLPMPMLMEETFQTEYTLVPWEKVSEFDLDQPEVLSDDFLDLGEIAAQYFGLGIDPYARRASMETLSELADDITDAVAAMTAKVEATIAPLAKMEIITPPAAENENTPPEARQESPVVEEAPMIEIEEEPEAMAASEPEGQESLFFKYLRQMRQG